MISYLLLTQRIQSGRLTGPDNGYLPPVQQCPDAPHTDHQRAEDKAHDEGPSEAGEVAPQGFQRGVDILPVRVLYKEEPSQRRENTAQGREQQAGDKTGDEGYQNGNPVRAAGACFGGDQHVIRNPAEDCQQRDEGEEPDAYRPEAEDHAVEDTERPNHGDARKEGDHKTEKPHNHAQQQESLPGEFRPYRHVTPVKALRCYLSFYNRF